MCCQCSGQTLQRCSVPLADAHSWRAVVCRDKPQEPEKAGDTFFDAPAALPARGSIPSVSALDPAVAAAKQQLADEAENAHLIHTGEPTSSPPVPAEVLVQCSCSLAFIALPDADWICHDAEMTMVHGLHLCMATT